MRLFLAIGMIAGALSFCTLQEPPKRDCATYTAPNTVECK